MIPFFDMTAELAAIRGEIDAAIKRVLDRGAFIGGEEVTGFERELAAFTGARFAIGASSGTDALHVIAMALGIQPGDEVITTPLTFFATAGAFLRLGARVIFADVDDATLTLDPRAALSLVTPKTRAIVPVHLFGHPAELPAAPCPIVEDSAQGIGIPVRGKAAALSFFPTKNLGALGDAGAVLTDDAELADRIALLRTQGARPKYHHLAIGGNFRLDSLQAAILRAKLPHLAAWTEKRRALADRYRAAFAAARTPVRVLPDHPQHVHHQLVIRAPRRDALAAHLRDAGIECRVYYPEPLHRQPCFPPQPACPTAEQACSEVLSLPLYPSLVVAACDRVVEAIERFYRTT